MYIENESRQKQRRNVSVFAKREHHFGEASTRREAARRTRNETFAESNRRGTTRRKIPNSTLPRPPSLRRGRTIQALLSVRPTRSEKSPPGPAQHPTHSTIHHCTPPSLPNQTNPTSQRPSSSPNLRSIMEASGIPASIPAQKHQRPTSSLAPCVSVPPPTLKKT
ncbi:hypothetical protein VTG60DRAFT_1076 [Thermothelomyces hinnuleus]